MKELERRIEEIDKGECNPAHLRYDYRNALLKAVEKLTPDGILIYREVALCLLKKISLILSRDRIILNSKYAVYSEDGDFVEGLFEDESGYFVSFQECQPDKTDAIEIKLKEELMAYQGALANKMGVSVSQINLDKDILLSSLEIKEKKTLKILTILDRHRSNMDKPDFNTLVAALIEYFQMGKFPKLPDPINVFGVSVKEFGWSLHEVHKRMTVDDLALEYLVFAKQNITLFKKSKFDATNFTKCNLYKYFTEKPENYKNH